MSRLIILSLLAVCFLYLSCFGSQVTGTDDIPGMPGFDEKHITKSVIISHSILENVFPGVEFRYEESDVTAPPQPRIMAIYEGQSFGMTGYFNVLLAKMPKVKTVDILEKLEAFIRLMCWIDGPDVQILAHENVAIEKTIYTFNHRFLIQQKYRETKAIIKKEILMAVQQGQIAEVQARIAKGRSYGMPQILNPGLVNEK